MALLSTTEENMYSCFGTQRLGSPFCEFFGLQINCSPSQQPFRTSSGRLAGYCGLEFLLRVYSFANCLTIRQYFQTNSRHYLFKQRQSVVHDVCLWIPGRRGGRYPVSPRSRCRCQGRRRSAWSTERQRKWCLGLASKPCCSYIEALDLALT